MDWRHAITGVLTAAVFALFARIAMRSPAVQSGDVVVLRYPKVLRWFLLGGAAFFVAVIASGLWPLLRGKPIDKELRIAAIGVPLLLVFTVGCLAEQRVSLFVDHDGIGGRTAFRGRHRIEWRDVVEVRWASWNQWFVLIDRHGTKLRVHRFLQGHGVVPTMLREHVPEPVWRDAVAGWERATSDEARSG